MDRKERFHRAYEYLRGTGRVHTQTDLAKEMGSSRSNTSAAYNGDPKFLTDNFLRRFNDAFGGIFNLQWLILGEGEMLKDEEEEIEFEQSETLRFLSLLEKKDEQIDRLIALLEQRYSTEDKKERRAG